MSSSTPTSSSTENTDAGTATPPSGPQTTSLITWDGVGLVDRYSSDEAQTRRVFQLHVDIPLPTGADDIDAKNRTSIVNQFASGFADYAAFPSTLVSIQWADLLAPDQVQSLNRVLNRIMNLSSPIGLGPWTISLKLASRDLDGRPFTRPAGPRIFIELRASVHLNPIEGDNGVGLLNKIVTNDATGKATIRTWVTAPANSANYPGVDGLL